MLGAAFLLHSIPISPGVRIQGDSIGNIAGHCDREVQPRLTEVNAS